MSGYKKLLQNLTDSVWCREISTAALAFLLLHLPTYNRSCSFPAAALLRLTLTGMDMGRMFFLPMPGDEEWTKGYVVEYLRPCEEDEIPDDVAATLVHSCSSRPDANVNQNVNWRSHEQGDVCDANVMTGTRKRNQRVLYTDTQISSSEPSCLYQQSMLGNKQTILSDVPVDKGQWHVVHFWGNDYTEVDSFPTAPPIFYPCYVSLNDRKKIFTNIREQKDPYTGKVQDWDFRLGTEVFDDGERKQQKGKRFTKTSWERVLKFAKLYKKTISFDCA